MEMSKSGVIKPQKIDSLRPINQRNFFQWKTVLLSFLKTNAKYIPFLKDNKTWPCLNDNSERGQADDNVNILDCLITALASYGPESLIHDVINECTSVKYYFDRISELFSLQNAGTGATIFQYNKMRKSFKHDGKKSYQDFYFDLRATRYETLLKKDSGITFKGAAVAVKEKMTPAIECGIVLDWLEGIDDRLPGFVEQKYAIELQTVTLRDLQSEISKHLDTHIAEIKDKEVAKAMRTQVKKENVPTYDETDSDDDLAFARFVRNKFPNQTAGKRNGKFEKKWVKCSICKETNRNPNHPTHKCRFMTDEDRKSVAKAFFTQVSDASEKLEGYKDGDDSSDSQ